MCGINLIFAYGNAPPVDRAELLAVRDAMTARGPDGAGEWVADDGRVGFGHRRLAIIDLSPGGAQPMHSADGRLSIAFNGEIYNYRALRAALEADGVAFRSDSDTEVLLALYDRYGPEMTGRLRGMYAFALWDADRRGLFLARDPFGIKPLYLADDGRTLRAASQVKALLAGRGIDTAPAPAGHAGFFLLGYVPEPFTLWRGIRALPAGGRLWVDAAGARDLGRDDGAAIVAAAKAGPWDRPALGAALADSIAAHLVADVPVGVFLSAGLDSTTIAALATEAAQGPLRTVTLGFAEFRGGDHDEVPLAEAVARQLGSDHSTVWVTGDDFAAEAERVLAAMDQPSIDGVNVYFVSKVTAAAGLKVALSGLGGDELFGGYPSFAQVPALTRRLGWAAAVPGLGRALRTVAAPAAAAVSSPKYAGLVEYAGSAARAYFLRRALYMPWELGSVLPADLARAGLADLGLDAAMAATAAAAGTDRQRVSALETAWYMRSQLLRDADWAGMAHGLEIRVPLVDVTLAKAVAPMLASPAPPGKRDMAAAPARPLPDAVLSRPKTGFAVPVRDWLLRGVGGRLGLPVDAAARGLRGWAKLVYAAGAAAAGGPG
ncbi:MAG: asparagine synthase (glutamine-hydrolyzing) [Alphaproteobacteria bacterium]